MGTRLAEARRLLAAASGGEVALATTADGLVEGPTTDGALIETASIASRPAAARHARGRGSPARTAVHFITDGAMRPAARLQRWWSTRSSKAAPNVAITAFEVRPSLAAANAGDAYLEIANFAPVGAEDSPDAGAGHRDRSSIAGSTWRLRRNAAPGRADLARRRRPCCERASRRPHGRTRSPMDDEAVLWVDRARPLLGHRRRRADRLAARSFRARPRRACQLRRPPRYRPASRPQPSRRRRPHLRPLGASGAAASAQPCSSRRRPTRRGSPASRPMRCRRAGGGQGRAAATVGGARDASGRAGRGSLHADDRARAQLLRAVAGSGRPVGAWHAAGVRERVPRAAVHRRDVWRRTSRISSSAPGFPVLMGNAIEWLARRVAGAVRQPGLVTFDAGIVQSLRAPRQPPFRCRG